MNRPTLRLPYHRGTTANVASVYPFSVQPTFGHRGALIGIDLLGGGAEFCWDPFEAYRAGLVTNPNCWLLGEPGNGKSALIKTLLYRQAAIYGNDGKRRWTAILDPKGEYTPLAKALGYTVIRLAPDGHTRINPLDPRLAGPGQATQARVLRQVDLCSALIAAVLSRPLTQLEESLLFAAVEQTTSGERARAATLRSVAQHLSQEAPTPPGSGEDRTAARALVLALDKLLTRSLRGMFDGHSTIPPTFDGPGVVIDLSALGPTADALGVVMTAATAWLQEISARPGPQRLQVLDEAWAVLGNRHTAAYLQRAFKLGRATGTANLCIAHRVSDLAAQADDGTTTAKVADGLLADAATKIVMRQAPDQLPATTTRLGLTRAEATVVGELVRGRALWKIGARTAVVHHTITTQEQHLIDTDQRMLTTHP
jgi:type IV secretory pathway VirB4 component